MKPSIFAELQPCQRDTQKTCVPRLPAHAFAALLPTVSSETALKRAGADRHYDMNGARSVGEQDRQARPRTVNINSWSVP
jgi:hypothetical protein